MKGLLIISNNMEDVEAVGSLALLKRAGFEVVTATFEETKTVKSYYGTEVTANYFVSELNLDEFSFLVIPGGNYVVKTYEKNKNIQKLILEFNKNKRLIAAICAAPMFIGDAGLLKGKRYTVFPGCEKDAFKGILEQYHKVINDGNIITARSVGALFEFTAKIIKYLKGSDVKEEFLKNIYY